LRTLRETLLVIFFGLPVAAFVQLLIVGVETSPGRRSDDLLNAFIATLAASMAVSL